MMAASVPTTAAVQPVFERIFDLGRPQAIRCDNGPPFGSDGAGGLTRLSVWWLKLGVRRHFIRPASPQDNGHHERMHRELKKQASRPTAATLTEQQARSMRSATIIMRNGRTRRLARCRRPACGRHQPSPCPIVSSKP